MEKGLMHLHNFMRWIVLLFALLAIIKGLTGIGGKKPFTNSDRRTAMFYMISCDIQLLLGLILYFIGPWGIKNINNMGMSAVMKDKAARFFAIEHAAGMLIAIILVHIGYSALKKNISDGAKFKRMFWYFFLSLIIIIATIPWPFRELVGRPWFPGMSM